MTRTPQDKWATLNGLQFHYRDWGGNGQPIVLLHGLASTCHTWDLVAPILAENYQVVALDQRGHGESDKPDYGYDFASIVEDLHQFIQTLELEKLIIAGHSWGGDVALEYAVAHPDMPKGLAFVDGGTIEISGSPGMTLEIAKKEMAPPDFTGITLEQLRERGRKWIAGFTPNRELEEAMIANFEVLEDNTLRAKLSRENHMRIIEALWEHRPSALFLRVLCPVLMVPARQKSDEHSEAVRRFKREEGVATAAKLLPKSKTVWLEDSIHDVQLQKPSLVASVIQEPIQNGFFDQQN